MKLIFFKKIAFCKVVRDMLSLTCLILLWAHTSEQTIDTNNTESAHEPVASLRTYVDGYTIVSDEQRSCFSPGELIKRGNPMGCGHGCQYVDEAFAAPPEATSTYARGPDFYGRPHPLVGPPDAWPHSGHSDYAWTARRPNEGSVFITFRVHIPVIVTGMEVFEVNNPGAIIKIEGRRIVEAVGEDDEQWLLLWEGPPSPLVENEFLQLDGNRVDSARVWKPPISAPRAKLLNEFRFSLNTSSVEGFSAIDAVKVLGDLEDGMPASDFRPHCKSEGEDNCWTPCRDADVVTHERLEATIELLTDAISWLPRLLRVVAGPPRLVLPLPQNVDRTWFGCGDIQLPKELFTAGIAGAKLAIFPTIRPASQPLSVATCYRAEGGSGRPIAIRINIVPQFAEGATGSSSVEAAKDAILQRIFHAIGWSSEYRPRLTHLWGEEAYQELYPCDNSTRCDVGWSTRNRLVLRSPGILRQAAMHFGVSAQALGAVELEQSGGYAGEALKLRIYNGEVMTPSAFLERAAHDPIAGWSFPHRLDARAKSNISLGLLEDLGWYFPVYEAAEVLPWGYRRGLDFALNPCNSWPDPDHLYTCPTVSGAGSSFDVDALGRSGCNALRTHVGVCRYINHNHPRQGAYTYFTHPIIAANYGGESQFADFCPLVVPEPSGIFHVPDSVDTVDCRVDQSAESIGTDNFQRRGPGSACFSGQLSNMKPIAGCYVHYCTAFGELSLQVGHQVMACPTEGGEVTFDAFGVTLSCPPSSELCPQYRFAVAPSVHATAVECSRTRSSCRPPSRISTPHLRIALQLNNFRIGADGTVAVFLNGNLLKLIASDPNPGEFRKIIELDNLPEATEAELRFDLVDNTFSPLYSDVHQISIVFGPYRAFVDSVLSASSEYQPFRQVPGDVPLPASALVGEPDQIRAEHSTGSKAWSPSRGGAGEENVTLQFAAALYPTRLILFESLSPGSLTLVEAQHPNGTFEALWAGRRDPLREALPGFPEHEGYLSSRGTKAIVLRESAGLKTNKLRLTFGTPSWPEIDTVQLEGYTELLPTVRFLDGVGSSKEVVVPRGGSRQAHLHFHVGGNSTLFWRIEPASPDSEWPDWLEPRLPSGSLLQADGSTLNVSFSVLAPGGSPASEAVDLVVRNAMLPDEPASRLFSFRLTRLVDFSIRPQQPPVQCYHGNVIQPLDPESPAVCMCFPGAYGQACEFLACPSNCSSPVGPQALTPGSALRGFCDHLTGVCRCLPGYLGIDCSGEDGDCYLLHSGTCRAGWRAGRYVLNTEDENTINKGFGELPKGFLCPEEDNDCYRNVVVLQFCCRIPKQPGCPFDEQAPETPCKASACENVSFSWTSPECLVSVQDYCFFHPEDAGCNAFRPVPTPPSFCPLELALLWCMGPGAENEECAEVLGAVPQEPSGCAFLPEEGNPCEDPQCQQSTLSGECRPKILQWCGEHPEDPECDAHVAGDGCLFLPGSPPCMEAACLPESYSEHECRAVINFHCRSIPGQEDPECRMEGYGDPPPHAQPAHSACPWDAIRAYCGGEHGAPTASCRLLRAYGVFPGPPSPLRPVTDSAARAAAASLKREAGLEAEAAQADFDRFAIDRERERRSRVTRYVAYLKLFHVLDRNSDGFLVSRELDPASRTLRAAKAELSASPVRGVWAEPLDRDTVLDALLPDRGSGNFVRFDRFAQALEELNGSYR
mmetsp:Transcript_9167/g.22097  ORF Transcript_9167/g.22097 Transcript_9167/m.22097 type:complete len:1691 (+) Transcript_9167:233-5305(+)